MLDKFSPSTRTEMWSLSLQNCSPGAFLYYQYDQTSRCWIKYLQARKSSVSLQKCSLEAFFIMWSNLSIFDEVYHSTRTEMWFPLFSKNLTGTFLSYQYVQTSRYLINYLLEQEQKCGHFPFKSAHWRHPSFINMVKLVKA